MADSGPHATSEVGLSIDQAADCDGPLDMSRPSGREEQGRFARPPRRFVVAKVEDVPDGERLIVDVNGRSVGVFHVDGEFYALLNRCPHQGGPLCHGRILHLIESRAPGQLHLDLATKLIGCPWHGWEFDLETGQSFWDPNRTRVRPYPVHIERGQVIASVLEEGEAASLALTQRLKGPYVAEVIPISVEDDYLVVTMRR